MKNFLTLAFIVVICVTPWLILTIGIATVSSWLFSFLGL